MNKAYFAEWYDYNFWADRRVWDCVMKLTDEQFDKELDYGGSVHGQCAHIMGVEFWWFTFLSTGELKFLEEQEYANRDSIRKKWDKVEPMVRAYLDRLTLEELEREVRPDFWELEDKPIKVWEAIMQVATHSTDHRAQTLSMLHRLGAPTVGQDVLDYIGERQKKQG